MVLRPEGRLAGEFEGLEALPFRVEGVKVTRQLDALAAFAEEQARHYRQTYVLETLKDEPRLRAYRDFFWRVGVDPTKIRPAAEALLRRVIKGKPLPTINTLVDAYNLASMETRIALAAFDLGTLKGGLRMRRAEAGETFLGIGMSEPRALTGVEIVVQDERQLVAVYPYRDADASKVTTATKNTLFLVCGVPGIDRASLREASEVTKDLVLRFCGGAVSSL